MQKSKLLRSLGILNEEEMHCLLPFLQSPYFNNNTNVIRLYKLLYRYYPDFSSAKLDKEKVFQKLYPGKAYAHQQLLNLMSEFNKLLERFLIIRQLDHQLLLKQKLLLEAYAGRPASYSTFLKKYQSLDKAIDELPYRDEVYYLEKMDLNLLYYGHPYTLLQKDDRGTLSNAISYFEAYKNLKELKLKCARNARQNTIKDQTNKQIESLNEEGNVLLNLYTRLEQFQRNEKIEKFNALIVDFKSNIQLLRNKDKQNILKILINYCTRKTNSGHVEVFHKALELYQLGLKHDCILIDEKISNTAFYNIITVGLICEEFDWVEKFIQEYQEYLDLKNKDAVLAMALGTFYFEKKEYDKAIDKMAFSFREPHDVFRSKILLVRCWFELWLLDNSYFELLLSQIESFEKFTRRDQALTAKTKQAFLNFIAFTKKLLIIPKEQQKLKDLHDEIDTHANLVLKKWLLAKVIDIK